MENKWRVVTRDLVSDTSKSVGLSMRQRLVMFVVKEALGSHRNMEREFSSSE